MRFTAQVGEGVALLARFQNFEQRVCCLGGLHVFLDSRGIIVFGPKGILPCVFELSSEIKEELKDSQPSDKPLLRAGSGALGKL